jgi:opacity protein-like surface antigen
MRKQFINVATSALLSFSMSVSAFIAFSSSALASDVFREGRWEASIIVRNQSEDVLGDPNGSRAELSDDTGWGFSFGYNFSNHLNFAYEFGLNSPSYQAFFLDENGNPDTLSNEADFFSNQFNLTYHILRGSFTPYVGAGMGWTYIDSNIGNGEGVCYADYYWGWYCYEDSYSENNFTYNLTAGLRLDINRDVFIDASYGLQDVDFSSETSNDEFEVIKFELGFKL